MCAILLLENIYIFFGTNNARNKTIIKYDKRTIIPSFYSPSRRTRLPQRLWKHISIRADGSPQQLPVPENYPVVPLC